MVDVLKTDYNGRNTSTCSDDQAVKGSIKIWKNELQEAALHFD